MFNAKDFGVVFDKPKEAVFFLILFSLLWAGFSHWFPNISSWESCQLIKKTIYISWILFWGAQLTIGSRAFCYRMKKLATSSGYADIINDELVLTFKTPLENRKFLLRDCGQYIIAQDRAEIRFDDENGNSAIQYSPRESPADTFGSCVRFKIINRKALDRLIQNAVGVKCELFDVDMQQKLSFEFSFSKNL